ncbi:hypothetical protein VTL71DRAFT_4629 [Oculimacula yallundae]|uniref:Uncharacterized protein n=1 Tax=Oculimacula yallundae TaxID=86028 RepID=A0ABR4C366_9HELO
MSHHPTVMNIISYLSETLPSFSILKLQPGFRCSGWIRPEPLSRCEFRRVSDSWGEVRVESFDFARMVLPAVNGDGGLHLVNSGLLPPFSVLKMQNPTLKNKMLLRLSTYLLYAPREYRGDLYHSSLQK